MNRMELLLHELDITCTQEDWYPPLLPALEGLTAAQASWRPQGESANTIWELVNHLLFYKELLLERLRGGNTAYPGDNDDTFKVTASPDDEQAWKETVARVEAVHRELREILSAKMDDDFDRPVVNNPLGLSVTSIVLHNAYHTGQIVQIRKMQGSWPARRSFE